MTVLRLTHLLVVLVALLTIVAAVAVSPSANVWSVSSVSKTVELSGSVLTASEVHVFRLPAGVKEPTKPEQEVPLYYFALSKEDAAALSFAECTAVFGVGASAHQRAVLEVVPAGTDDASGSALYAVKLPTSFFIRTHSEVELPDVTLTLNTNLLHQSQPLPKEIAQRDTQNLLWVGDAQPRTVYGTEKARLKVRVPTPKILSFSLTPKADSDEVVKSKDTISFGPWSSVKALSSGEPHKVARVHYTHTSPVVSIVESERHVEVSHWGDNLAVEDQLWLRNDGPALKGFFSRIDHQMALHYTKDSSHALNSLLVHLPPGAKDAYYIDLIGNISTSHFMPSKPSPSHMFTSSHLLPAHRASTLDLQPRYPLLGGWNFSFSVGFNLGLGEGGWGKAMDGNRYSLAVPFLLPITDVAVDSAKTRVVLPEGASQIEVIPPFKMDSITNEVYTTYLDTVGRPSIILQRAKCSDQHGGNVLIRYTLTPKSHFQKPLVISAITMALFMAGSLLRRFEAKIKA